MVLMALRGVFHGPPHGSPGGCGFRPGDRVDFDLRMRLEFRRAQISSDGGLLMMHELDDALGLSGLASSARRGNRLGKNTIHRLGGLFRQSVCGRLAGYEEVNDADQLALDPVRCQIGGGRAAPENRDALADLNGQWLDRLHDRKGLKSIVLDMDSSVNPTHGDQEGSA